MHMLKKSNNIQWVAHRGDCEYHIENTIQSVQTAINNDIKILKLTFN